MGWPPAVVIVVRHGARLDASDKQWHLTSPTPYDPPLTYGGWIQSRALGNRIASILRSRETDDHVPLGSGDSEEKNTGYGRPRRHRVIIHSSPFLRCIQTSIGISSGLAQHPNHPHIKRPLSSHSAKSTQFHPSPRLRPTIATDPPRLTPIVKPSYAKSSEKFDDNPSNIKKSTLRVDAFLGEWLSPDYFESITPPPDSVMMVAGAKADLLRREDYSNLIQVRDGTSTSIPQGFPGGWGSPVVAAINDQDDGPSSHMASLAQNLPRRDRTSSLSSAGSSGSSHRSKILGKVSAANTAEHGIYQPPIPAYAMSHSEPIPPGYVAHARDACVAVDFQWDSMREPQNCGNGGEYGEEWSSMHKRFRRGLQQLVDFYRHEDDSNQFVTQSNSINDAHGEDTQEDEDTELVIILVTHGAGCNALIGALTNQPVLLDVGMASLTMAVRKAIPKEPPASASVGSLPSHPRSPTKISTISDEYDVRLIANTEHLRPSTTSTPTSSRGSPFGGINILRQFTGSSGGGNFVEPDRSRSVSNSSNFGSIRRAASAATTPLSRTYNQPRNSSIGLWRAPQAIDDEAVEEPGDDLVLNFGDDGSTLSPSKADLSKMIEEQTEEDDIAPLGGLWGSPRASAGGADIVREIAPKRRWTVNEKGVA